MSGMLFLGHGVYQVFKKQHFQLITAKCHYCILSINFVQLVTLVLVPKNFFACTIYSINTKSLTKWMKKVFRTQGSQEQEVKFQDPMFTKFQDIFVGFTRLKNRKCTFFCPHKCYSLKQISIAVLKMLLRHCYT